MLAMLMPGPIEMIIVLCLPIAVLVVVLLVTQKGNRKDANNPNLEPCPDCGRLVSLSATTCPQCGRPLNTQ
jgi:predicted amidophosphoribosyltransferase